MACGSVRQPIGQVEIENGQQVEGARPEKHSWSWGKIALVAVPIILALGAAIVFALAKLGIPLGVIALNGAIGFGAVAVLVFSIVALFKTFVSRREHADDMTMINGKLNELKEQITDGVAAEQRGKEEVKQGLEEAIRRLVALEQRVIDLGTSLDAKVEASAESMKDVKAEFDKLRAHLERLQKTLDEKVDTQEAKDKKKVEAQAAAKAEREKQAEAKAKQKEGEKAARIAAREAKKAPATA